MALLVVLGGLVVGVLAIVPKVSGFKTGRGEYILKGDTNPQHAFLRKGREARGHMLKDFTAR
jgi:hypothetical protein